MHAGNIIAVLAIFGATCACSSQDDWRDHNRPATYGAQCATSADCSQPFSCLGPPDAGPYWPICTVVCDLASDCPTWSATGHCPGPITPVCNGGFCDYMRCQ